jgi:very-short-patch-repair endonuclease
MESRDVNGLLAALGGRQHGVFLGQQALSRGVTPKALQHRVSIGWILRLKQSIYRLRDHPWTWEAQLQAALFDAGPGAVVSHRSAARLHTLWRYRSTDAIEVTAKELHDHCVTLGRLHRSAYLPPTHRTVVAGFPVTTVARTCFDLFGDSDPQLRGPVGRDIHAKRMRSVLNDALGRHGLTLAQLTAVRVGLAKRGRPGSALARNLTADLGPLYVPTQSDGESLLVGLIEEWGLERPERQVPMSDERGWIGNLDFFWPPQRVNAEVDGSWHDGPLDKVADKERDDRLEAIGINVARVRYDRLLVEPNRFMTRLMRRLSESTYPNHG